MDYRRLGATDMDVSVLGFGCGRFSQGENEAVGAVHAALAAGVNYFDVAPLYDATRAETILGRALRGHNRRRYYVATKIGRYVLPDGTRESDFSAARVRRSVDESLARLGLDHVDVIQCHDLECADLSEIAGETLPALAAVCGAGKARYVGVTGFPPALFSRLLARVPPGSVQVLLSYGHYTLQNTALADWAPEFRAYGAGLINAAPFGMGLLTGRRDWWHDNQRRIAAVCADATAHCRARGADLSALALQFSCAHPAFSTTLVGMGTAAQVRQNLAALERVADPSLLQEVRQIFAPVQNLGWPSGRPENN